VIRSLLLSVDIPTLIHSLTPSPISSLVVYSSPFLYNLTTSFSSFSFVSSLYDHTLSPTFTSSIFLFPSDVNTLVPALKHCGFASFTIELTPTDIMNNAEVIAKDWAQLLFMYSTNSSPKDPPLIKLVNSEATANKKIVLILE